MTAVQESSPLFAFAPTPPSFARLSERFHSAYRRWLRLYEQDSARLADFEALVEKETGISLDQLSDLNQSDVDVYRSMRHQLAAHNCKSGLIEMEWDSVN